MTPLGNDRWRGAFDVDRARTLPLHGHRVGRRVPVLAARLRAARRRRTICASPRASGAELDRRRGRARRAARTRQRLARVGGDAARRCDEPRQLERPRSDDELAAIVRPLSGPPLRHDVSDRVAARRRSRARALLDLVRALSALVQRRAGRARHVRRCAMRGCRTSRRWASTCSTCRRSTRSAACTQGPEQHARRRPGRLGSPWAIGAREGGHTAIHPAARHARRISAAWSAQRARARHRDRARHRVPVRARPSVRRASIPSGSASGPTAPSSTPRTRRRNTRTSIRSTSRRDDWQRAVATSCASVLRFWIDEGVRDLPRRQSAHQAVRVLGVGDRRGQARASGRDLPGRGVHAAEGDAPAGEARLHAVVHLLHLAQHEAGADRVLHRAHAARRARVLPAEPAGRTRPTSCPSTCSSAAGRRSWRGWCWRRRSARTTASTGRRSSCSSTTPREPGSEEYLELGEVPAAALGPRRARTACAPFIARVNRIRRENPALQRDGEPALSSTIDNDALICYCKHATTERQRGARRREPRSAPRAVRLGRRSISRDLGIDRERSLPGARPADRRALSSGSGAAQLRDARPAALAGAHLPACAAACAPSATSTIS